MDVTKPYKFIGFGSTHPPEASCVPIGHSITSGAGRAGGAAPAEAATAAAAGPVIVGHRLGDKPGLTL